jgi:hypothetical protein
MRLSACKTGAQQNLHDFQGNSGSFLTAHGHSRQNSNRDNLNFIEKA